LVVCVVSVQPAQAAERYQRDLAWGTAAVGAGLLYAPTKVTYAILGAVVGSLAYAWTLGDIDVAHQVWSTTLGGTYVLTPAMLRGEEPILFAGETYGW
jgi:hypothetical protein